MFGPSMLFVEKTQLVYYYKHRVLKFSIKEKFLILLNVCHDFEIIENKSENWRFIITGSPIQYLAHAR